jgi:hypothetical protein
MRVPNFQHFFGEFENLILVTQHSRHFIITACTNGSATLEQQSDSSGYLVEEVICCLCS